MAIKLPEFSAVRTRVMRTLRPSTKLGRTKLWLGGLSILFISSALDHRFSYRLEATGE